MVGTVLHSYPAQGLVCSKINKYLWKARLLAACVLPVRKPETLTRGQITDVLRLPGRLHPPASSPPPPLLPCDPTLLMS